MDSLPPPPLRLLPAGTTSCRVGIAPTEIPNLTQRTPRQGRKIFDRKHFLSPLRSSILGFQLTPGLRPGLMSFGPSGACLDGQASFATETNHSPSGSAPAWRFHCRKVHDSR